MKKTIKISFIALIIILVLIQLYRPERFRTDEITQDDITKKLPVPENVRKIMERSCYDCHSNHTKWPWYSNIAPVSWLVIMDVNDGRKKMNFSEWGKISQSKQVLRLESICEEITDREMPLKNYLLIHRDAELSDSDRDILCSWSGKLLDSLETDEEK